MRSIKGWPDRPDRVVVLARMALADYWSKLANLALIMDLSKVCPCLALVCFRHWFWADLTMAL